VSVRGLAITFAVLLASICLLLAGTGLHDNLLIALGVLSCCSWIMFAIWFVNSRYGNL